MGDKKIQTVRNWKKIKEGAQFEIVFCDYEDMGEISVRRLSDGHMFHAFNSIESSPLLTLTVHNFFIGQFNEDMVHVTCYMETPGPIKVQAILCEINDIIIIDGKLAGIRQ